MKTILVPTDLSKNADAALRYAIRISNLTAADIRVLNCYQYSSYQHLITETEKQRNLLIKKDGEEQMLKLQQQVQRVYKALHATMKGTTKIQAEFNPFVVEETIAVARKIKADLIVMGTHGTTGIQKFLFGSNTSNMVSKSPVPVLAIPEGYRLRRIKTLLFASDLENFKEELKKVTAFAKDISATVKVLHFEYGEGSWELKKKEITGIIAKNNYPGVTIEVVKADARYPLMKQLRNYMHKQMPGCLVMFTKERGFWEKLFVGSKTEDISCALPLPLLSFRK